MTRHMIHWHHSSEHSMVVMIPAGRHQPKNKPINIRRGGGGRGCGVGTLASPAYLFILLTSCGNTTPPHPAGDHKGPPNPASSSLAPTDRPVPCLICRASVDAPGGHQKA